MNRRSNDEIIARVEQKLDDLIMRFDDHLKWANEQVHEDGKRILTLEKAWRKVEYPVLAIGIITSGFLIWIGSEVGKWIARHFTS